MGTIDFGASVLSSPSAAQDHMPGSACSLRKDRQVATATVGMVGVDLSCDGRCYKLEKRGHTSGGRKNVSLLLVLASSTNTLYLDTAISRRVLPQ